MTVAATCGVVRCERLPLAIRGYAWTFDDSLRLARSQNLRNELAGTGVTVQVVMPGATATDFWDLSGRPLEQLPSGIVMSSEDLVDAALIGLDRGEFATIPSLQDGGLYDAYESARQAMIGSLSTATPAPRYRRAA